MTETKTKTRFKIEKNIEMPSRKKGDKYNIDKMEVGDSIDYGGSCKNAYTLAKSRGRINGSDFAMRGTRIWRTK